MVDLWTAVPDTPELNAPFEMRNTRIDANL